MKKKYKKVIYNQKLRKMKAINLSCIKREFKVKFY